MQNKVCIIKQKYLKNRVIIYLFTQLYDISFLLVDQFVLLLTFSITTCLLTYSPDATIEQSGFIDHLCLH